MGLQRVIVIVLDSVGIGALPDAAHYGDEGAHTLKHIAEATAPFSFHSLQLLGLGQLEALPGVGKEASPHACYGKMAELSPAKDTTTGHWEMAGVISREAQKVYPQGFPKELIRDFEKAIGRKTLGNVAASGTMIIEALGKEHLATGFPIVYTSADSVFQIACHEEVVPVGKLFEFCEIARGLCDAYQVGRVIARPFIGESGDFVRTKKRRDYAMPPPEKTVLEFLQEKKIPVVGIGKIGDIFSHRGIDRSFHTQSNPEGLKRLFLSLGEEKKGLIFVNLVDFDMLYGHRRDPRGYAQALHEFDRALGDIILRLRPEDLLLITADHGCDPTYPGTDHTREYVPLLGYSPAIPRRVSLGVRESLADIGATVAEIFGANCLAGKSFIAELALE